MNGIAVRYRIEKTFNTNAPMLGYVAGIPMISFENFVIHQSGNNLKLNFKDVAVGVPVLEGDGGFISKAGGQSKAIRLPGKPLSLMHLIATC